MIIWVTIQIPHTARMTSLGGYIKIQAFSIIKIQLYTNENCDISQRIIHVRTV